MTGKVPNLEPVSSGLRMQDGVRQYWSPFFKKWITKKTASGNGGQTYLRAWAQINFQNRAAAIKRMCAEEQESAMELAKNTPFLMRDILMKAQAGNLYSISADDGLTWEGRSVLNPTIQQLLDSLTTDVGSILVRTDLGWLGLRPGLAKQVLTMNDTATLPEWDDPTGGGGGGSGGGYFLAGTIDYHEDDGFCTRGEWFQPDADMHLTQIGAVTDVVTGAVYSHHIATWDPSAHTTITNIYDGPMHTIGANDTAHYLMDTPSAPIGLSKGVPYCYYFTRHDAATNVTTRTYGQGGVYNGPALSITSQAGRVLLIADKAPAPGAAWTTFNEIMAIILQYTLD